VSWGTLQYTLRGTTDNGIVVESVSAPGSFYLLSHVSYSSGQALNNLNTTDPYTYCFLSGTAIATPEGEVPVEHLKIGDLVCTVDGRTVPVKWLGEQRVKNSMFTPNHRAPVCICKGALGNGLPLTDLFVSADHGLLLDDYVVNASALVDDSTIRFVPMAEMAAEFTYYHIETDDHDVVLANGTPAETFIDYAGRQAFDNYQEYLDLYPTERLIPEMPRSRISAARLLPDEIKARIVTGFDWDAALDDPAMTIALERGAA